MFDVSKELREQTINIIDDLVDEIAPGYLSLNLRFDFNYRVVIYEEIYKYLWSEFGRRRFENVDYRNEVFDLLRTVQSEKFFDVIECVLKIVCACVHTQSMMPDDIILNPSAGNELWSRKKSMRDRHIIRFERTVDELNRILAQNDAKYRYNLHGESVQMVMFDSILELIEDSDIQEPDDNQIQEHHQNQEDSDIQEPDDNQIQKHHQNRNRSELWNKRNYIITVVALIFIILDFAFGDSFLIRLWNSLPTIKEKIAGWFR